MARCSCGGVLKERVEGAIRDERGNITGQIVQVCDECGRRFVGQQQFVRLEPTKKEREGR